MNYQEQFLISRITDEMSDGVIVGMLDVRHNLGKEDLKRYYGHIGYSVRPSERRKGYAKRMLREALSVCPDLGLEEVLITCNDGNEASRRTILANGGVFDGTVFEPHDGVCIHRYRIRTIAESDPAV